MIAELPSDTDEGSDCEPRAEKCVILLNSDLLTPARSIILWRTIMIYAFPTFHQLSTYVDSRKMDIDTVFAKKAL